MAGFKLIIYFSKLALAEAVFFRPYSILQEIEEKVQQHFFYWSCPRARLFQQDGAPLHYSIAARQFLDMNIWKGGGLVAGALLNGQPDALTSSPVTTLGVLTTEGLPNSMQDSCILQSMPWVTKLIKNLTTSQCFAEACMLSRTVYNKRLIKLVSLWD